MSENTPLLAEVAAGATDTNTLIATARAREEAQLQKELSERISGGIRGVGNLKNKEQQERLRQTAKEVHARLAQHFSQPIYDVRYDVPIVADVVGEVVES